MRRTKTNAVRVTATVGGRECRFDSKAEKAYAEFLEHNRRSRDSKMRSWTHHPPGIDLFSKFGVRLARIKPDFLVELKDGRVEYHEVKGWVTPMWRLKVRWLKADRPDIVYRVIDASGADEGRPMKMGREK